MTLLHTLAALLIVAMWGLNFTVIRFGLDEFTPFTFATWRFVISAVPIGDEQVAIPSLDDVHLGRTLALLEDDGASGEGA